MTNPVGAEASRDKCSARFHLRGADFFVYDVALQLTRGGAGLLTASRETIARKTPYRVQTVSLSRSRLIKAGWLKPVGAGWVQDQRRSGKAGHFQTPKFHVVQHSEWAAKHPGKCITDDVRTVYGQCVHGETESGEAEHGPTVDTVHGRTHDTVHGGHGRNLRSSVSNTASTEEEKTSSAADFGNPKTSEEPVRTIAEMQVAYRRRWKRGFSVPASTRPALEELVLDRGSDAVLRAFELFLKEKDDDFLLKNRHPIAAFVKRFEVYHFDQKSGREAGPAEDVIEYEGKMIPVWLRDEKLKDAAALAEKKRKREEREQEDAKLTRLADSTPL